MVNDLIDRLDPDKMKCDGCGNWVEIEKMDKVLQKSLDPETNRFDIHEWKHYCPFCKNARERRSGR